MNPNQETMPVHRGMTYFQDSDGLWKVRIGDGLFIAALDDSKIVGERSICSKHNTPETCKTFIDWTLGTGR
jgi:hypothetical protein